MLRRSITTPGDAVGSTKLNGNFTTTGAGTVITASGDYAAGCIGNISGTVGDNAQIIHNTDTSTITGTNYTAGCIGYLNGTVGKNAVVANEGDNSVITGTNYTGGCIGYLFKSKVDSTAQISYLCSNSTITGNTNTG